EIMIAGPASSAAARPVTTKIPAPIIAPTPSDVSETGPSTRFSRCSPAISAASNSKLFRTHNCLRHIRVLFGGNLLERHSLPQTNRGILVKRRISHQVRRENAPDDACEGSKVDCSGVFAE